MKKVCHHERWISCCSRCYVDGVSCVYITPTERVVCWHTGYETECNAFFVCKKIDGRNVVIKDRNQRLVRIDGQPLKWLDRHDDMWSCRLINDKFSLPSAPYTQNSFKNTALIIMDMWDKHPGPGSSLRSTQLAPAINVFANFLRERGALIIHSPSERGVYDVNNHLISPAARQARRNAINARISSNWLRSRYFYLGSRHLNEAFDHIVEGAGQEWPTTKNPNTGQPTYQTPLIDIHETDAISATMLDLGTSSANAYPEMLALTVDRPNLIWCGIHTNMCILARPNSMRTMAKAGKSLWLVRDLTDASLGGTTTGLTANAAAMDGSGTMYRNKIYDHFEGTDLVVDWIGRNLGAETWTSDKITGGLRFRFTGPYGDNPNRVWPRV